MALLNGAVERVEVPGEEGQWLEFRAIRRKDRLRAADAVRKAGVEQMREMGADLVIALRRDPEEDERQRRERAKAVAADPLLEYDVDELLRAGVVNWSYPVKVTPANLDELDQATAEWAARQVLRIIGIVPEEEREAARKNA